ncbi:MAG: Ppx/GppA family phosphatase [Gracilimonas sp.]|uniref:Ppx/GppA phosphatase family protein n=1 Tax=Gracilimonas sp. TaxID=1974203 RepID=UPI0019C72834|nr:Ppx/GppA phosphatase family protein [Gracilimonas sp.]MBD3615614.1 Ppx/GppA family phosphatase [Gracilimonas sp.]
MKAAIDIGTNTVLLLVAEMHEGMINSLHEEQRVPRLGKGVDADKNINQAATDRVIEALSEYKEILASGYPEVENVTVTATSAVRDANNREEFIQNVRKSTGYNIKLLSGREEAEWTAAGALSMFSQSPENQTAILDIGGGSTEIALLNGLEVKDSHSFDMGSVRFTERFLKNNPPKTNEITACREEIKRLLESRPFIVKNDIQAVGVAGTVTTLAGMILDLETYQPEKLNGFSISAYKLQNIIDLFSKYPSEEMLNKHPVYLKGRADIFLAGMLILEGFMTHFKVTDITVSTGGIRHGAVLKT